MLKLGGQLSKLIETTDDFVEEDTLLEFFDLSEAETTTIRECHKLANGIEGQIYEFSTLHFAY